MGIFSSPVEVQPRIATAMSKFWADGRRTYVEKEANKKVGAAQAAILATLGSDDPILLVTPCYSSNLPFEGVLVISLQRVLKVKGNKVLDNLAIRDLGSVTSGATKHGHFVITIESLQAAPFREYRAVVNSPASRKYFEATIVAPVLSKAAVDEVVANLSLAGFTPQ